MVKELGSEALSLLERMAEVAENENSDVELIEDLSNSSKQASEELAELKKQEGNALYKEQRYREALKLYKEAIDLCPNCAAYYGNKAACLMMMGYYRLALEEAQKAVKLDHSFVKGYLREAKCHLALGDATAALYCLQRVQELEPKNSTLSTEFKNVETLQFFIQEGEKAYEKKDFRKVVFCMDRALQQAVDCTKLRLVKAECLAFLGRYQEAQEIANDLINLDPVNVDALYVRGMCLYYQDHLEKAFSHFQQVLKLTPEHAKARDIYRKAKLLKMKKDDGNTAFKNGQLQEAYNIYSSALKIDENNIYTNAKLYFNRATVSSKINKLQQAIDDCNQAIKLDENYLKAYLRRAKCYMDMNMYEEAIRDYETVYKKDKTREHKQLLDQAKLELKKSKRKDYYQILGVNKNADDDEIKKAYRKRALIHHPDRHSNASDEEKREQEKKFKELGEAYSILSDPKKRTRYDNGYDLEDGEGVADIDPNHIFQAFFGGPGGFTFTSSGSSGYGQGYSFPGGFSFQFG